ncbi:MAG TPA: hypothetical protein VGT61_13980 [Thermomicrobiales bacterium]|jgi:hypothetical protein|nr:hypothetical protein [Thermomicrobiales bacterium]
MTTTISLRDRLVPMLRLVAEEYANSTPAGYPEVTDDQVAGIIGLSLDPSFTLFFVDDRGEWTVTLTRRNPRTDARSSASSMRHGGAPLNDHRTLPHDVSDQTLRNLIAELKMHFNQQPGLIHMSDS